MNNNKQNLGASDNSYLAIYCFILFNIGSLTGSIGPIIPFLSKERGRPETEYSFLFSARALGGILGLAIIKYAQKTFQFYQHKLLRLAAFCMVFAMIEFINWKVMFGQFIGFLIFGAMHYLYNTLATICIVHVAREKSGFWIPFSGGLHGIGAISSPIIIGFLGVSVYYVLAGINSIIIILCSIFPTPTLELQKRTEIQNKNEKVRYASWKVEVLIALGYLSDLGVTVAGWLPSYAVLSQSFDEKEASFVGTLFWVTSTTFRFVFAGLKYKNSSKLSLMTNSIVLCSLACLILHHQGYYKLTTILGSLWFGFSCSAFFSLLIAVPIEFGLKVRPEQISNIMFVPILSSLVLVGPIGSLMGANIDNLFYAVVTVGIISWVNVRVLFRQMRKESVEEVQGEELKELFSK